MGPVHASSNSLPTQLREQIFDAGYYPEVVSDAVAGAIGDEQVHSHLVHHEATFNSDEVLRHLTVMAITDSRLIIGHTDEHLDHPERGQTAITSTEAIALSKVNAVSLTRVVGDPSHYAGGEAVVETWFTAGWGTMRRIDIEPAGCADPTCDADHGFSGTVVSDDFTVRMSPAADGPEKVAELVAFATALQQAVGR